MVNINSEDNCALIIIDVQNCFMPKGTLPVANGGEVVPFINKLIPEFKNVILTQDWHPAGHISFASAHSGAKDFDIINLDYGAQVLWPDHAIIGTSDADFHEDLNISSSQLIIRKGYHPHTDSYSAFIEADGKTKTGLCGYLRERGIDTVYLVGLATDFCVAWSAIDARTNNFRAIVIDEGCRAIDLQGSLAKAWQDMSKAGVEKI